ncbi:MAG: GFA family protein [Pontixanthobacter sp.]
MTKTITGGCLCGEIQYEIDGDPVMQIACHCTHCQRQAGSAFSTIVGAVEPALKVSGEPKTYQDSGESGHAVWRQFCGSCGSPLFSKVETVPGLIFIKAGTLHDPSAFPPLAHIWTKSKQDWVELGNVPAFQKNPEG